MYSDKWFNKWLVNGIWGQRISSRDSPRDFMGIQAVQSCELFSTRDPKQIDPVLAGFCLVFV